MQYLNTSVATLLRTHPWAEEVLEWHGASLLDVDERMSLSALCWLRGMNTGQVVRDLLAAQPDDHPDELLESLMHADLEAEYDWTVADEAIEFDVDVFELFEMVDVVEDVEEWALEARG